MVTGQMAEAVLALTEGKVVAYPTDTLWGLGCDIYNVPAIERIHAIKGSPEKKPLSVAVHRVETMDQLGHMTPLAAELAEAFLPGPLTLIVERRGRISPVVAAGLDTIGLRVPDNATCRELLEVFGPVTSTSANRHGGADPTALEAVRDSFGDDVAVYLEGEEPRHLAPSTVVDVSGGRLEIVREGVLKKEAFEDWL